MPKKIIMYHFIGPDNNTNGQGTVPEKLPEL